MGRYELGRVLGHGTFAKVYHARHLQTGESVAIKVLDREKAVQSGLVSHIKHEIVVLRRVRHPNIVHLFEVMATKTKIYFIVELVRGGELFSRVSKGQLKEDTVRRYFQHLISTVGFCHTHGVFHRDLKPENLLLPPRRSPFPRASLLLAHVRPLTSSRPARGSSGSSKSCLSGKNEDEEVVILR